MNNVETICVAPASVLDIEKTFECGQCFRWNADSKGVYTGTAGSYHAKVWTENGKVYVRSSAPEKFWAEYFDLECDYSASDKIFSSVPWLDECVSYGRGIRILSQDPWEALCSFIISQCNNITRIKGIVERLCELYGEKREFEGEEYHAFPSPQILAGITAEDLAVLRSGYRAPYIINAARKVSAGEIDLEALKNTDAVTAKNALKALDGVGDKVANCAVLFGLHHMEAFPVDVWIKRALKEHFPADFDPSTLGELAGLAQQYIFYYARSTDNKGL